MADRITADKRSLNMSKIKGKNTKPELLVRKNLWRLGYRYRIHVKTLPGKPDIFLPKYKTVILVNGCFWHGHSDCREASKPKSNSMFWNNKINANIDRDIKNVSLLKELELNVIVIWECELDKNKYNLTNYLIGKLKTSGIERA